MTRRQKYFLKQKLIGVGLLLLPFVCALFTYGEALVMAPLFVPIGLWLMFTKTMAVEDDYYFEVSEKDFEDDEEL